MSTKTVAPEFKGATAKMYNLLKSGKSLTHAAVMAFKKANELRSAYQILFRLRRYGLRNKLFTITATGDTKQVRTYKLVKGVAKGVSKTWPKALPVRSGTTKKASVKTKAKTAAKTISKPTAKKQVKKAVKKAATKPKLVAAVEVDDNAVLEA